MNKGKNTTTKNAKDQKDRRKKQCHLFQKTERLIMGEVIQDLK